MPKYRITIPNSKYQEVIKFLKKQKIKYKIEEETSMVSDVELRGWEKSYEELNNLSEPVVKSKSKKKTSSPIKRKKKSGDDFVLTPELKKLLDERLKDAKENPGAEKPWSEVRKGLLKKLKAKKRAIN
jgi:hypothetical protein